MAKVTYGKKYLIEIMIDKEYKPFRVCDTRQEAEIYINIMKTKGFAKMPMRIKPIISVECIDLTFCI